LARPAARFEGTPSEIARPAPLLGEHSTAILAELGFAEEQIQELVDAKAVFTASG
jgi:formyl-CoA transferase